jgi:hypothetical protein
MLPCFDHLLRVRQSRTFFRQLSVYEAVSISSAHESHQGVAETKQLLREKVWWPGIDNDVETMIKNCHACQLLSNQSLPPPVNMSKLPDGPWKNSNRP